VNVEGAVRSAADDSIDGTMNLAVFGQQVRVTRTSGSLLQPFSSTAIVFDNVRNYYQGSSSLYSIQTYSTDEGLMEEILNVSENVFVLGNIIVNRISMSSFLTGSDVNIRISRWIFDSGPLTIQRGSSPYLSGSGSI
jgi:hypothetical protein